VKNKLIVNIVKNAAEKTLDVYKEVLMRKSDNVLSGKNKSGKSDSEKPGRKKKVLIKNNYRI